MRSRFLFAPFALSLFAAAGCGSLDANPSASPVLSTLKGQLLNPMAIDTTGNVRVAVVWLGTSPGQFNVAQDLPVQPLFPSQFVIQLDSPPPAQSLTPGFFDPSSLDAPNTCFMCDAAAAPPPAAPTYSAAVGSVVAYLDNNGNGKLDLVPSNASAYVDQIIGANQNMVVLYVEGSVPTDAVDSFKNLPSLGYNLLQNDTPDAGSCETQAMLPPTLADAGFNADAVVPPPQCSSPMVQWLAMDSLYDLTIANNPEVNALMCQSTPDNSGSLSVGPSNPSPSIPPGGYPAANAPGLVCTPNGSSYTYTVCTTVEGGICQGQQSNCTSSSAARPTPVPASWPCP